MHCLICNNEIYGVMIHGHCRDCAQKKIIAFDRINEELKESQNHVDDLLTELRRLAVKNQSLQNKTRMQKTGHEGERRTLLTEEEYKSLIEKLGKIRDSDLAREYGVSDSYVCRTRQKLGIATFANNEELWEKIDPVIFGKSIRALAAEFGIDRGRIERRRKKLQQMQESPV